MMAVYDCAFYRAINPFNKLQELFPHRVDVKIVDNPLGRKPDNSGWEENWDFADMKWADVIFVNNLSNFGGPYTARVIGKAREFGKFTHFDTDDLLTDLYEEHKLFDTYKNLNLGEITKFIYFNSDLVTVTQMKFADRIKPFCGHFLSVIKNAIDYNLPAWNQPKRPSKPCRIGWAGGIHHLSDTPVMLSVPHLVNQKVGRENVKWNLYGHPPPDPKNPNNKDWQHETWMRYVNDFMKGFKGQRNYEIYYALPPDQYGVFYADMDIAIAPLKMNAFNDSKSDIKVAEAGRYKIPLISSNVGCYNETIINGKTGYLIDPDAPNIEWVRILSKVAKDKKHRDEMGANLHAITEEHFNLNKVVHHRLNIYEECFKAGGFDPRSNRGKTEGVKR